VEGLGGDPEQVSSPTFTIVQQYDARVPVQHVDLYRLSPGEVDDLALEELWEGGVLVVEWPDRWQRRPADAIVVEIELGPGSERTIAIAGIDDVRSGRRPYRDSTR
jgi:tRNA threonylcarbamoyl adenosine modification protein YjeE